MIRGSEVFDCNVSSERIRGEASDPFRHEVMLNCSEVEMEIRSDGRRAERWRRRQDLMGSEQRENDGDDDQMMGGD
ncbi:hypothetical protein QVD17_08965 [Tagetes erecta]|uniref:Uncharacterized protein n=1 Tax=Tagetes erecta TaxID=13708 RepID=A0AAD8NXW6_TARER|nr:hypothetical protein QVD17_08965 [Tagetes erecta]